MILTHGTSSANSAAIQNVGLLPRTGRGNWCLDHNVPSVEGFVYLTSRDTEAQFHALRAAVITDSLPAYVAVKSEGLMLYPDENYFATNPAISAHEMIRMQDMVITHQTEWRLCLDKYGLACHQGPIAADRIDHVLTTERVDNVFYQFLAEAPAHNLEAFDSAFQAMMKFTQLYPDYQREISLHGVGRARFEHHGRYEVTMHMDGVSHYAKINI